MHKIIKAENVIKKMYQKKYIKIFHLYTYNIQTSIGLITN